MAIRNSNPYGYGGNWDGNGYPTPKTPTSPTNTNPNQRTYNYGNGKTGDAGYLDYVSSQATPAQRQKVYDQYGIHPVTSNDDADDKNLPRYTGGGNSGFDYTPWFQMLMGLADSQYNALSKAYREQWKRADDQARRSSLLSLKQLDRMGNKAGNLVTQRGNVYANRDIALRDNRSRYDENLANANSQRLQSMQSLATMLPQMDANNIQNIMAMVKNRY